MKTRGSRTVALRLGVAIMTAALAALAITTMASAGPAASAKKTACFNKSGMIKFFAAEDTKAVIGTEIGPAGVNGANAWVALTNSKGGILGCKVGWDVVD